ncbi:RNA polymerase sigma factor [Neiella marina]|uniref:RNA polymerase sigma factor n=1 Tax=Neiella marina TaxID=508461 RepID=A0A8J2XMW0_9GAMM|nr:sigma-70 family RNA polymerase sigma factor [Neiella marina]GGA63566.1 RNA polymerase sigma factor [Neiella marina]
MSTAQSSVCGYTASTSPLVSGQMKPQPEAKVKPAENDGERWKAALCQIAENKCRKHYAALFNHFAPRLKMFAIRLCDGNEALALELVQDTMMTVWQKAHLYNAGKGAASTWIYTIARNLRYDQLRKASSKADVISAEDLWPVLEAEADEGRSQPDHLVLQLQLEKYYDALSPAQMEVIRKVYLEDKPQQQVADELNIPLGTVKSRIRLAVQKLQEKIEANDHD